MTGTANQPTELLTSLNEEELLARIAAGPYVPLYRVLLARRLRDGDDTAYRKALRDAALYTPDRVRFYEVLHQPGPEPAGEAVIPAEPEAEPATLPVQPVADGEAEPVLSEETEGGGQARAGETPTAKPAGEKPVRKRRKKQKEIVAEAGETGAPPADDLKERLVRTAAARQVSLDEKHTFLEWLDILENPGDGPSAPVETDPLAGHAATARYEAELHREIEQQEAPGPAQETGEGNEAVKSLAERSVAPAAGLATETLAKIMLKQGKIKQALAVYEELRLKYPEKSDYFAALIEDLKAN